VSLYTALRGWTDYLLDFFGQFDHLCDAVAPVRRSGHPVSVRVTYEVDVEGLIRYWPYGGEVKRRVDRPPPLARRIVHGRTPNGAMPPRERLHFRPIFATRDAGWRMEAEAGVFRRCDGVSEPPTLSL